MCVHSPRQSESTFPFRLVCRLMRWRGVSFIFPSSNRAFPVILLTQEVELRFRPAASPPTVSSTGAGPPAKFAGRPHMAELVSAKSTVAWQQRAQQVQGMRSLLLPCVLLPRLRGGV